MGSTVICCRAVDPFHMYIIYLYFHFDIFLNFIDVTSYFHKYGHIPKEDPVTFTLHLTEKVIFLP